MFGWLLAFSVLGGVGYVSRLAWKRLQPKKKTKPHLK